MSAQGADSAGTAHNPLGRAGLQRHAAPLRSVLQVRRKGASLTAPSWDSLDVGFALFPVERYRD
jgi:hypothetical protein